MALCELAFPVNVETSRKLCESFFRSERKKIFDWLNFL